MAGLSMFSRLAIVVGVLAVLSPCALAQNSAPPGRGKAHSKMRFTPVKARFGGTSTNFSSSLTLDTSVRSRPVGGVKVSYKKTTLGNTAFARSVGFRPVTITRQTNATTSNFAKSRSSFKKAPVVRFVRTAPLKSR